MATSTPQAIPTIATTNRITTKGSCAIPFGETPEQRKREFQEALRKILRVGQDRDSSNKRVWTEALHLLDNARARVPNHKRPKDPPKRWRMPSQ